MESFLLQVTLTSPSTCPTFVAWGKTMKQTVLCNPCQGYYSADRHCYDWVNIIQETVTTCTYMYIGCSQSMMERKKKEKKRKIRCEQFIEVETYEIVFQHPITRSYGCRKHTLWQSGEREGTVTTSIYSQSIDGNVSCFKSLYLHPPLVQPSWPGEKQWNRLICAIIAKDIIVLTHTDIIEWMLFKRQ